MRKFYVQVAVNNPTKKEFWVDESFEAESQADALSKVFRLYSTDGIHVPKGISILVEPSK